jgi:hypothetical protein
VLRQPEAPIPFDELVCSTLATLRIDESVLTGQRLAVDAAAFLESIHRASIVKSTMKSSVSASPNE